MLQAKPFVVVIDPAGDARNTGRQLDDGWERGATFQCAQELQKRIESHGSAIRVVLTRMPGESLSQLQQAQLANQLQADLFISLNFYQERQLVPHWYMFMLDLGHDYLLKPRQYTCYYYDQAHLLCAQQTNCYAQRLLELSSRSDHTSLVMHKPHKAPLKMLMGVTCPAFAFDIGIQGNDSWKTLIDPLCSVLHELHAAREHA